MDLSILADPSCKTLEIATEPATWTGCTVDLV
jgi:hypothetical protein